MPGVRRGAEEPVSGNPGCSPTSIASPATPSGDSWRFPGKANLLDTIILLILMITAIAAAKGAKAKVVVPLFLLAYVMVVLLFAHHTTSTLDLNF